MCKAQNNKAFSFSFLHSLFSNSYLSNSSSSNTSSGVYSSLSDSSSLSHHHHHLSITTKCEATLTSSSSQDPASNDLLKSKIPVGIAVGRQRPQVANSSTALASSVAKTSALDAKSDKQSCAQVLPITSTLMEIDIYLKDVWDEYHLQFACRQSGFISNPI